jgi:D-arabinose 1-dehydrogenase-like Zn-dependent alcohol dehydrogenase
MTTAKAAFLTGPRQVEVREVSVGSPGPEEVQIQTLFSGISAGTEMNVYRGRAPQWEMRHDPETRLFARADSPEWRYPLAYGYANVGRVVDIGAEVTQIANGDVVFRFGR